ncbi:hypothetical protein L1887_62984 [Cichorium endivia]|nr:hypothetical protein L1887_62984 [Cichorium endivia]
MATRYGVGEVKRTRSVQNVKKFHKLHQEPQPPSPAKFKQRLGKPDEYRHRVPRRAPPRPTQHTLRRKKVNLGPSCNAQHRPRKPSLCPNLSSNHHPSPSTNNLYRLAEQTSTMEAVAAADTALNNATSLGLGMVMGGSESGVLPGTLSSYTTALGLNEALQHDPRALWSSFAMIIVSEIGDKTFLIAAILAMRQSRLVVFSGAFASLAVMSVLSALLGVMFPSLLPKSLTNLMAAALFLVFGLKMVRDGLQMSGDELQEEWHGGRTRNRRGKHARTRLARTRPHHPIPLCYETRRWDGQHLARGHQEPVRPLLQPRLRTGLHPHLPRRMGRPLPDRNHRSRRSAQRHPRMHRYDCRPRVLHVDGGRGRQLASHQDQRQARHPRRRIAVPRLCGGVMPSRRIASRVGCWQRRTSCRWPNRPQANNHTQSDSNRILHRLVQYHRSSVADGGESCEQCRREHEKDTLDGHASRACRYARLRRPSQSRRRFPP